MTLDDEQAIIDAMEGASAKNLQERGRGLGTTLDLTLRGYHGCMLVVSGQGAIFCDGDNNLKYRLPEKDKYEGTLISMALTLN